jgi:hypothetical protein
MLPMLLAACSTEREKTVWPPSDWYLEVRSGAFTEGGYEAQACFQAWSDGFALYREAEGRQGDAQAPWPAAWSTVAAWQMGTESTRQLSRLVQGAKLDTVPPESGTTSSTPGPVVSALVRGFGGERRLVARDRAIGGVARLLHVVNAYLPDGRLIALPEMTGDPEDRHLTKVPQPKRSRKEALDFHETLLGRIPGGDGFLVDAFALAVVLGDRARAEKALARIEQHENRGPLPIAEPVERREAVSTMLRGLLPKV